MDQQLARLLRIPLRPLRRCRRFAASGLGEPRLAVLLPIVNTEHISSRMRPLSFFDALMYSSLNLRVTCCFVAMLILPSIRQAKQDRYRSRSFPMRHRGCGRKVGRLGVRIGVRMFSMEDRRRAVDLYFTEGMTIRKVIAELGYPSEGALVKWVREDPRYTGACRRSYTLECKTNAARRALEGEPLARVARDAGCTPTSVYQWMRRYRSEGILGLMDRRNAPMPAEPMPAAGDDVEELRRQVEVLRLENAVMRETIDVLKADDPRLDPSMLTNRERTRVVDAIRGEFGLAACLKAVGLKRSTYYYERGAIAAGDRYAVLRARVAGLFEQGGRAWGYRTIHRMLRLDESDPIVVSEKVVRRIMREGAMRPVYLKRPKRWSSYAGEIGEAPANLVERDFHADAPNMLWVTDVTQFTMDGYKCWLSPVVDCFDGMVVSWTLSRSPNADMANRMLLDAVATLRDGEHPIIHSDRGCHYRWDEWIRICEEHGLIRSMSAKGCSPDNAAAEGFFGRLKNELFYGRDWRGVDYEEFRERLAAYLTHYNETRIKKSLDWMSPVQYRRSLGLAA